MQTLLRIGQVSNLYGISLDTLRYYDRKGLLKPVVDKENGYRYYSLEHLDVLEMLLVGRYLEIPLEQMKEQIEIESIDGYLAMMKEQNRLIEEKCEFLRKLSLYTGQMTELLETIQNYENDYTFEKVTTENVDVTIYNVDLNNFIQSQKDSSLDGLDGIEAFEQWFDYNVNEERKITENSQTVGLSIHKHVMHANKLRDYLEFMTEEQKATKYNLTGTYRHISFWGKENDLQDYLRTLCNHFKLKNTVLNVKFRFALLHNNMEHEYFADIYFS
jgi:Predicted transcriptional regulators